MGGTLRMTQLPNPGGTSQGQIQAFSVTTQQASRANRTSSTQRESAYRSRRANQRTAAAASTSIIVSR